MESGTQEVSNANVSLDVLRKTETNIAQLQIGLRLDISGIQMLIMLFSVLFHWWNISLFFNMTSQSLILSKWHKNPDRYFIHHPTLRWINLKWIHPNISVPLPANSSFLRHWFSNLATSENQWGPRLPTPAMLIKLVWDVAWVAKVLKASRWF